jgi:CheY-like chemotaxis protein
VVCDDEEDASFLNDAFRTQPGDISISCLDTGQKLLDHLRSLPLHECPFLIILDQYLRDMDSLSLVSQLKTDTHTRLIPVALMSGFASEELIRRYYLAGANCFYKKPLDPPDWSHMADCLITLFNNNKH